MNELRELYATLTQGEKKLISQQLNKDGKSQLIKAFNTLKSSSNNNTSKKDKAKESILNFQLKEFITNELTSTRRTTSIEIELRHSISEIEFLKERFLNNQALKKISKLKSKLLEHERYTYLQELLLIETEIQYFNLSEQDFKIKLEEIIQEYNAYKAKNAMYYHHKVHFYKQLSGIHITELEAEQHQEFNFSSDKNRSAHYYLMRSQLIEYLTIFNFKEASKVSTTLLEFTQRNSHEMDKVPFQKMDVYFMSSLAYLLNSEVKQYKNSVQVIETIYDSNKILETKYTERINYLLWVGASIGNLNVDYSELIQEFLSVRSSISLEFELRITEQIANFFIEINDFNKANKWNRDILNKPKKWQRSEFNRRAELRAIYIANKRNKMDLVETMIHRTLSNKVFKDSLNDQILSLLKSNATLSNTNFEELLPIVHFWKKTSGN